MATKTDNAHLEDKLALRRYFLTKHAAEPFTVIDCCAGSGHIWNPLRKEYRCSYFGIDVKQKNGRLRAESQRILQAGATADVIDIDTYGSPWEHWLNVLPFINKKTIVFITIGSTHTGNQQKAALEISGLRFNQLRCPPTLSAKFKEIIASCCVAQCYNHGILIAEAQKVEYKRVCYIGLCLKKGDG